MPVERRGPTIQQRAAANQRWEEPVPDAKPYQIPKQLVWEAYKRVKANRGAAGVDGETLAAFEQDLKGNLYKIWNRMASGSYFPPAVRLVEIPKGSGGTRPLGIPVSRSYCTSTQAAWGWCRGERVLPCQDTPWSGDARRAQRRRADLRSAVTTAGVKRTHQGPCGAVWIPSNRPSWHQAAIVETETFSSAAAARAE